MRICSRLVWTRGPFSFGVNGFVTSLFVLLLPLAGVGAPGAPYAGRQAIVSRSGYVKIGLQRGVRAVQVRVAGPVKVIGPSGTLAESATGGTIQVTGSGGAVAVSLNGRPAGSGAAISIVPAGQAGCAGTFSTPSGTYRGRCLLAARGGSFDVINHIMIEDWLRGVLPAEIGGEAPLEALKAQAVAARSEAVRKLIKSPHAGDGYDFCTGVHCQAYKGTKGETATSNQAVDATFGAVLVVDNEVLDGVYHNVCGGATALPDDVWDCKPLPGFIAVLDNFGRPARANLGTDAAMEQFLTAPAGDVCCNPAGKADYPKYAQKYYRWQKSVTGAKLSSVGGVGRVKDVKVIDRRPSGRVRKLAIVGERGTKVIDKELPIRNALDLWSGLFVVHVQRDAAGNVQSATFTGAGNGHGVGLCQHGARVRASRGETYEKILRSYYPAAQLARIYKP